LGGEVVPMRIRAVLIVILSVLMGVAVPHARASDDFLLALGAELGIGLKLGITIRVAFAAAELAGELIAQQLGFGLQGTFNAMSEEPSGTYTQLFGTIAGHPFFAVGGHLEMIRALAASVHLLPPGGDVAALLAPEHIVRALTHIILRGLAVAAPLSIAVLTGQVVLGFVARIAPQLNAWSFGFLLTGAIALFGASLAVPSLVHAVSGLMQSSFADLSVLAGE
jgi:flagellar biosynthetic protein FliR